MPRHSLPGRAKAFKETGGVYPLMVDFCSALRWQHCLDEPVRIGCWNLQRYGVAKMKNELVMDVIVQVSSQQLQRHGPAPDGTSLSSSCNVSDQLVMDVIVQVSSQQLQRDGPAPDGTSLSRWAASSCNVMDQLVMDQLVMDVTVQVISNYDLIVLQEVTDTTGTAVPALITAINTYMGSENLYVAVESPRIGRNSYKEQYVFVYMPSRMTFVNGYKYVEQSDVFQVEPFIAHFTSNSTGPLREFAVIPLHAKPSDALVEMDALVDVYDQMILDLGIEDTIILGDFNAGCNYIVQEEYEQMRLYTDPRFHWLISDHADTTTKTTSCPYDRCVYSYADATSKTTSYPCNRWGIDLRVY
ncbi:hypothetical protein HAZT_HAZT004340 [Hyalella azteca]|uniref:Endonuclease/exonuclease/phosphatase domain-containing protein n=1 Tax=Hyalella azteca TaxID=294128 RepID=A0A6A0HAM3_HYAAZ|nr:hypothetical protein HAZT_HAZT004340 [Hyalella azteca]